MSIFICCFVFLGCDKPHPEPEKLDPIYSDLEKELSKAENAVKFAEKELEGFEIALKAVVPQTGQIRYAQKRVSETRARVQKLKQMAEYWKLRIDSRKKWAREKYLAAYEEKKPWPPPSEWEEYVVQRKLEVAPRNWSNKQRIEQAQLGLNLKGEKPNENPGQSSPQATATPE